MDFSSYKKSALAFLERCYPSDGVFDATAWEASGENSIHSAKAQTFVKPEAQRNVALKTLEQRIATRDWAFASTPGGCESLEGGHSALEAYFFLGELDKLSADDRASWNDYFNAFQDRETGYFLGPYIRDAQHRSWRDAAVNSHPWSHMHDHMTCCLCPTMMLLDGKPRYRLSEGSMTGRFLDKATLEHYLYGRDWTGFQFDLNFRRHNPWWMGNEFWYPGCILWQITQWEAGTPAAKTARTLLDEVWYRWHDGNMGITGFWYGDLDGDPDKLWRGSLPEGPLPATPDSSEAYSWVAYQIMGAAHQLWLYDADGHAIAPDMRKKQTDILLALQNVNDHCFSLRSPNAESANSNNCTDVDCMTLLANNYHRQDYRRADIEKALHDAAITILNSKINRFGVLESRMDEAFFHCFNSYETYSPAGWGNVHNQSFYFWALLAAFSVVKHSDDAALATFLAHDWPQVPSHWLWVPKG